MSSFIVNDLTINRIITFLSRWDFAYNTKLKTALEQECDAHSFDDSGCQKIGKELKRLNWKATEQRYGGKLTKEEDQEVKDYEYFYAHCTIEQAYKHLSCLTYQMSEGDVPETKLFKILDEIENRMAYKIAWDHCDKLNLEWEAKPIEVKTLS